MGIKREQIDELLSLLRIEDVVGEVVTLQKSGANYKGLCPFHNDNNPSFMVSPSKNICKCFVCNEGGNPITFYSKYHKISFEDSAIALAKKIGYKLNYYKNESKVNERYEVYYNIMDEAHNFFKKNIFEFNSKIALEYLLKRDIKPDIISKYELGYASNKSSELYEYLISKGYKLKDILELGLVKQNSEGRIYDAFRNRIIFPIYNTSKRVIAFGGRTLENSKEVPKYINSPDTPIFKKGNALYGIERISIVKNKDYSILMEGYMDVLSALTFDFDTCLAPLGTSITVEQISLLKKYTKNVILSFDMDAPGLAATERAGFLLKQQGFNVRVLSYDNAKDPDEYLKKYGKKKFLEEIKESKEIFDFLYDIYVINYNLKDAISKQKFIERFKDFFSYLNSKLDIDVYLNILSNKVGTSKEVLEEVLIKNNVQNKIIDSQNKYRISEKPETIILNQDFEIELNLIKYFCSNLDKIKIFDKFVFNEKMTKILYHDFFKKIKENENICSIYKLRGLSLDENLSDINKKYVFETVLKEMKNFVKSCKEFDEADKEIFIRELIMYNFHTFEDKRNELELYKTVFRHQIKNVDLKKMSLLEKQDFKKLEIMAREANSLKEFVEIYKGKINKYL